MVLKSSFISGMIIFRPGAAKKKSDKKITFDFFYTLIGGCFFFWFVFSKTNIIPQQISNIISKIIVN